MNPTPNTQHPTPNTQHPTPCIVGVDTGGTFTDIVVADANGGLTVRKLPSTPHDPSQSVLAGIAGCGADGLLDGGYEVVHGTTVATNALLQRRGARAALITTRGFQDVLEIGRQTRADLYAFHPTKPLPLLPRNARFELNERLDWQGNVVTPLDETEAARLLDALQAQGFESLAVCFLFAYLNPLHERLVERLAQERGFDVSLSCDIAPEPREYERASTTAANAFVAPLMAHYLTNLQTRLTEQGAVRLRIMQSNGGALSASEASRRAITTALSGPAGGIVAAAQVGTQAGFPDLLTFDMGGTSSDVALILDGQCPVVTNGVLGDIPLRTPMLDIHTVGAGGGSLARIDRAGGLRVGPESAGADPGPVAYGRGETLTVTDANILLGRLPDDIRLAGSLPLDGARVRSRFEAFALALGCTVEQAAQGILDVANATMTRALRHVSVERGHDPALLTLLSFGGAGGLHACALASALGMRRILIPRFPGAFSAFGLTQAAVRREYVQAVPPARLNPEAIAPLYGQLTQILQALHGRATQEMSREGYAPSDWQAQTLLDMRYAGQSFELRVPLLSAAPTSSSQPLIFPSATPTTPLNPAPDLPILEIPSSAALLQAISAFHDLHSRRFGYADTSEPVQVTALRLVATAKAREQQAGEKGRKEAGENPIANSEHPTLDTQHTTPFSPLHLRPVYGETGWRETPVYARAAFASDAAIDGPALITQEDATLYVASGWRATADVAANLLLTC